MALFPEEGLVEGSQSLVSSDAFGITGFDQVFTAEYQYDGIPVTAYIAQRETAEAAQTAARMVRDFYLEYGGAPLAAPEDIAVIDILDTIEAVLSHKKYVIGVHEAPDKETALGLAELIRKRLQETADDRS